MLNEVEVAPSASVAPRGDISVTLAEFIEANLEQLLAEWQSFAETVPAAKGDVQELRDGAEAMLRAVAQDLKDPRTAKHQREKSRGNRPGASPNLTTTGQDHAAQRLDVNFTPDQLVSEYRALRTSVMDAWSSSFEGADRENLHEIVRFNEALDQSLTEAVRWFNSRLDRSRDMFVGILSLDLRNLLDTVATSAELPLISEELEEIRDAAGRIRRSGTQMRELIDVLLDFTRTRLGQRLPIHREETDLAVVCRQVKEDFVHSHLQNAIEVNCTGILTGFWDEGRIAQALSNLIKNAMDHGKLAGAVTVACKGRSDEVLLSVRNEGEPIPLAEQREIFEPLRRDERDQELRYTPDGVGLGLYIVDQIALAHGGTVGLKSNANDGTTFTIRLPRHESAG